MWRGVQKWQTFITCRMVFKIHIGKYLKWSETNLSTKRSLVCSGTPGVVDKKSFPHIHRYLQNQPKKQMRNKCLYEVRGVDLRGFAEISLGYWPGISKRITATATEYLLQSTQAFNYIFWLFQTSLVASDNHCSILLLSTTDAKIWLKTKNCIMHILFL